MAVTIELTKNITVTDGGETVLDRQFTRTITADDVVEGTLRINNGSERFICIPGSEGVETNPMVMPWSAIRGCLLNLDVPVEVRESGAEVGEQHGPGVFGSDTTDMTALKIVNASGLEANIKYILWGNR